MQKQQIIEKICQKILFEGLELEDLGMEPGDINADTDLFENGIDLDSVDLLEVVSSVQREFGIRFEEVDAEFIEKHCKTPSLIADVVLDLLSCSKAS